MALSVRERLVGDCNRSVPCTRSVEKHSQEGSAELQIPPLRYAPVGMTKGRVVLPLGFDAAEDEQQVPPLRCAPVGMTLLLGTDKRMSRSSFRPLGGRSQ
jgi:hypothetical protein